MSFVFEIFLINVQLHRSQRWGVRNAWNVATRSLKMGKMRNFNKICDMMISSIFITDQRYDINANSTSQGVHVFDRDFLHSAELTSSLHRSMATRTKNVWKIFLNWTSLEVIYKKYHYGYVPDRVSDDLVNSSVMVVMLAKKNYA